MINAATSWFTAATPVEKPVFDDVRATYVQTATMLSSSSRAPLSDEEVSQFVPLLETIEARETPVANHTNSLSSTGIGLVGVYGLALTTAFDTLAGILSVRRSAEPDFHLNLAEENVPDKVGRRCYCSSQ